MATFTIKRGDTIPLRYALLPASVNLAGASVVFNMRGVLDRAPARIVTASPPVVEYIWQPGDTARPGLRPAEFEVTYPDGIVETFPTDTAPEGRLLVHIVGDLG